MKKTLVVSINKKTLNKQGYTDLLQWLEHPNHEYIGRSERFVKGTKQSKWANPFSKKKYGHQQCIQMYREYILQHHELLEDLHELEGKVLGCWCKPGPCHGDVLVELLYHHRKGTKE